MSGRIPLVVFAPEELAGLIRQRNDTVMQWQPLVWKTAKRLWNRHPLVHRIGSIDDLVQVGTLAVVEAIRCYNPDYRTKEGRPVKFMTYVHRAVEVNMLREATSHTLVYVPEYIRKAIAGYPTKARASYIEDGRRAMNTGYLPDYFQGVAKPERIEDERVPSLEHALGFLGPDDRKLIMDRYGMAGQPPKSYREMGEERHLSKERIRQKLQAAYQRLREHMPGGCDGGTEADCAAAP
jgi:RNA polymerase sigma factor (sigma-70 family)